MSHPCLGLHAPALPLRLRAHGCVATALLASTALALPLAATAQTPVTPLEPVVVVGTREPQPLARSTADVTLITPETIRDTSADSVEELLRREAGMQLVRNGGPGQSTGYFFRGASTSGTVVLVDGVRVGSATLGQAEFEALSLAQIDHIEVLRGPASSLYGADAVGGVVLIFTRRGTAGAPRVTGSAAVGGERSSQADIGVSGAQAGFDYAAHVGRERSRGVSAIRPNDLYGLYNPDDDGYARNAGSLQLGYTPAVGHRVGISLTETRLKTHYDSAEYASTPPYAADPSPDFLTDLRTRVASLDYRGEVSSLWTTTAQVAHDVDDSTSGGRTLSRYKTDRDQGTWQNALNFTPDQQLVLGYEFLRERVDADGFGGELSRHNHAGVIGYSGRFGAQTVDASVRHDANSVYGGNTTGGLGYAYALSPAWKLRARAGTTFRAPSFNDLYYPGYGVSTIKPERGRSVEVGAEWQSGTASASATVYRNRMTDLIGYDPVAADCPAGDYGCAGNISRARMQGATLAAANRWGGLALRGTVDFLDARDTDTNARLARRAAHQESMIADYTTGPWSVGGTLVDVGSRPDGGERLGGYGVVDLRAGWRFLPQWRLEAKLLNALDHRVEPVRDYQGLGRQAWLGVRYDGNGI